ncbi:MAG: transcription elongation factor GreA [Candidatus Delongbacteria bacterium]|jgi:transcription elongation factor GreA|nr:transcription elongation factor GreA [Candidatus Delongbacteria bacterium]
MNYVTEKGMKDLIEKLYNMKHVLRQEILDRVEEARKLGDLKENGDYKASREDLTRIDSRIGELENYIAQSQIISKDKMTNDVVRILNTVKIIDHTRKKELEYTLVSQAEADPIERKISADSPIGKGLLGKKVGDKFLIHIPIGEIEVEILEITS